MALETEFTVLSHLANNDKVQHIYNSVISNMLKKPTLSRIVRRLKSFSYDEGKMNVPNIDDHILELGVELVNQAGDNLQTKKPYLNCSKTLWLNP